VRKVSATWGSNMPSNSHRWLWAPAFAGTTAEFCGGSELRPSPTRCAKITSANKQGSVTVCHVKQAVLRRKMPV
jgi:hypothetical protein